MVFAVYIFRICRHADSGKCTTEAGKGWDRKQSAGCTGEKPCFFCHNFSVVSD